MSERVELLGERLGLIEKQKRQIVEVEALRDKLRQALPLHEDAESLDGEKMLNTAIALRTSIEELQAINKKIGILSRQLGE